jgi:hypothetical protein
MKLRVSVHEEYPEADLRAGVLKALSNPFYVSHPETIPYRTIRSLSEALQWPKTFRYFAEHPKNAAPGWSDEIQGVTHDDGNWFFTTGSPAAEPDLLLKFPLDHDLSSDVDLNSPGDGILVRRKPPELAAFEHFCDLDCFQSHLYVPLHGNPPPIAVFRASDLAFVTWTPASPLTALLPWCAVNPKNGLLYASLFYDTPAFASLHVWDRRLDHSGLTLKHLGTMPLFDEAGSPVVLSRIQGGAFSPTGHLYLSVDTKAGGVMGFDLVTGRRRVHYPVAYDPESGYPKLTEELEGITVWDLESRGYGQVHLVMIDNDVSDDDLYFKHFVVSSNDRATL